MEKSRVPRGATGPRRFSTRASSTHPKHTKVPGPGRLGAPPSCVELGEPLDCSHFPGDPRPQKPRRSDPGCAPRGAPGHRTPGLGGSGRGCRRPELGIKTHTFSHILKPLPKDRQGDLKMKPSSFQGAERRIPPSPSSLLLLPVPNCSLGSSPDEPALSLLLCLCFMMFIITLWK